MGEVIKLPDIQTMFNKPKEIKIPHSAVIVQARMTSRRFPGKSMAALNGKPVIHHVLERCQQIRNAERVILASPQQDETKPLYEYVEFYFPNVCLFLGDAEDVLTRYCECACSYGLEYILRVTGDCPFIDPIICMQTLNMLVDKDLDYVSNVYPTRTFHKGLDCEAFTFDCLEAADELSSKEDREHVTPWMQNEPEVKKGTIKAKKIVENKLNLCVDYPHDIQRLETISKMKIGSLQ